ncbi:Translation initiation factor IF-2 Flags: Precursor [Monoraphidium neglectum]|uniref:Translation initiation factor IF-2, chloroplastic n=1 Tax=Monoraphidium neglectum TaxID=145388 RepID=A0A0D2JHT3_9CHLO|nr:Translation initiation factor IF-2 Flags: Precursor [Monoraphidium neglectum]KIY98912.1 Translation initiation factor IF-2 Flags: Precursor [Monoraphidium neglectum]|eukprot:XP_013897932.1 Translation initiation factor IF-2 Flags: Precursor [Monoraphidium neglectum]
MEGKLRQVEERLPMGSAKVKAVFGSGKKRVAGCEVLEGKLVKGCQVEVKRGKEVVHKGTLESLRRVKDAVDEVAAGLECGVGVEGFTAFNEGDTLECFQVVTKSQRLEEAKAASIDASAYETA